MRNPRDAISRGAVAVRTMLRRMSVGHSANGLWQLLGYVDGEYEDTEDDTPVFEGIGIAARPAVDSSGAEVIVAKVGGKSGHAVVIATRDESIRIEIDEDEIAIFNSVSQVRIRANGEIEAGSRGGTFEALATKAELKTVRDELHRHEHAYIPGLGSVTTPTTGGPSVTSPTGTLWLMGE